MSFVSSRRHAGAASVSLRPPIRLRATMRANRSQRAQRWWRREVRPSLVRASWKATTGWVALLLVVLAGAAAALDSQVSATSAVRAWVPNIVVGALTVAATITVVEHALRNAQRRKDAHIVSYIHEHLDIVLIDFGYMLATDYGSTHLATFEPIPATFVELCELWLRDPPDGPPLQRLTGKLPPVIASAENVATYLDLTRARYAFVVESHPDLVNAIDRLSEWVRVARNQILGVSAPGWPSPEFEAVMRRRAVSSVLQFLEEFAKLSPEPFRLSDSHRAHGREMHERAAGGAP